MYWTLEFSLFLQTCTSITSDDLDPSVVFFEAHDHTYFLLLLSSALALFAVVFIAFLKVNYRRREANDDVFINIDEEGFADGAVAVDGAVVVVAARKVKE